MGQRTNGHQGAQLQYMRNNVYENENRATQFRWSSVYNKHVK